MARFWTNPSVIKLAGDEEPVCAISRLANSLALNAIEKGWNGPPYDPFELAALKGIEIVPREDVLDARIVPVGGGKVSIEYNPNRPKVRIRYSVAHELAHTIFPDCADRVRNRTRHKDVTGDEWQLEMLCNVAAAELLMPMGSLASRIPPEPHIDTVLDLRRDYQVSAEAILLRLVRLAKSPWIAFAASKNERASDGRYRIDYAVNSAVLRKRIPNGYELPIGSVLSECTAIGYTAKRVENWAYDVGKVNVECVGIPSYPGHKYPRVIGMLRTHGEHAISLPPVTYLKGDATEPRGTGTRILANIVNDKALSWGAGFGLALRKKWPEAQKRFTQWATDRRNLKLGNIYLNQAAPDILLVHMVSQHGYGPSQTPRIRYAALRNCLIQLAAEAAKYKATVHMPRIGTGEAGGNWSIVSELIDECLTSQGIRTTIYDLPGFKPKEQLSLGLASTTDTFQAV